MERPLLLFACSLGVVAEHLFCLGCDLAENSALRPSSASVVGRTVSNQRTSIRQLAQRAILGGPDRAGFRPQPPATPSTRSPFAHQAVYLGGNPWRRARPASAFGPQPAATVCSSLVASRPTALLIRPILLPSSGPVAAAAWNSSSTSGRSGHIARSESARGRCVRPSGPNRSRISRAAFSVSSRLNCFSNPGHHAVGRGIRFPMPVPSV